MRIHKSKKVVCPFFFLLTKGTDYLFTFFYGEVPLSEMKITILKVRSIGFRKMCSHLNCAVKNQLRPCRMVPVKAIWWIS
jgi:hypothetical protein